VLEIGQVPEGLARPLLQQPAAALRPQAEPLLQQPFRRLVDRQRRQQRHGSGLAPAPEAQHRQPDPHLGGGHLEPGGQIPRARPLLTLALKPDQPVHQLRGAAGQPQPVTGLGEVDLEAPAQGGRLAQLGPVPEPQRRVQGQLEGEQLAFDRLLDPLPGGPWLRR